MFHSVAHGPHQARDTFNRPEELFVSFLLVTYYKLVYFLHSGRFKKVVIFISSAILCRNVNDPLLPLKLSLKM